MAPRSRSCLRGGGAVLVVVALAGCTETSGPGAATTSPAGSGGGASGQITAESVQAAVAALDGIVTADMSAITVPGAAVAVVYGGKVLTAKGFGIREVGRPEKVDADTVFQLASVSKPLGSTAVAAAATSGKVAWTDSVQKGLPGLTLKDPWISTHVTIGDMYAHRSGLPDHSGDILEDLGFSQDEIFGKLRQEPLSPFRDNYAYTNYGVTAGGESAAKSVGSTWTQFTQDFLLKPLGMSSTTYSFAELESRQDRAALHAKENGQWKPNLKFDVDRQAPAGGASSSVNDLAKWVTMLLAGGKADGKTIVGEKDLLTVWAPQSVRQPAAKIGAKTGFYGFGWNIDYDSNAKLMVQHSGAFGTGAATNVLLLPEAGLGIITLTNGEPVGLPEAINYAFIDQAKYGKQTNDWLKIFNQAFTSLEAVAPGETDYSKPPATVTPAKPNATFVGTYANDFYGPAVVAESGSGPTLTLGPKKLTFPMTHYTADQFTVTGTTETFRGVQGMAFAAGPDGAESLTIQAMNESKLGVFTRSR